MIQVSKLSFCIQAWDGWSLHRDLNNNNLAPLLLRRRIGLLGQHALRSAWNLPDAEHARYVFSSRHGEFSRTLSILESYIETDLVSPADFSLSVHHALIGLLSIAKKNHKGHTAIAAGNESFCLAVLEAYALLQQTPNDPVILIHCDEPLMGPFEAFNEAYQEPVALVLLLTLDNGERFFLQREAEVHASSLCCHALEFLNFLDNKKQGSLVSKGETAIWNWSRYA